ncbi:BTAD domain-containing putative transcriptional regulator [Streptomyces sp. NPDC093591]|uniref:AfsR/SARP family transcriptional regulator n=1 Tax=Streptomyces sp. NPDC093591 TaxID=3366044 RepID=UPI00380B030A
MLFRVLGPVQIRANVQIRSKKPVPGDGHEDRRTDRHLEIRSPVRRAVLTALLLRGGRPVGTDELTDLLWDEPPASATANIRSHLTGLRRDLESADSGLSSRLTTYRGCQSGYALQVSPDEVDVSRFTLAARHGRALLRRGEAEVAVDVLEDALSLWRGSLGQDPPRTRWFDAHIAGLDNARYDACQDLFTACILTDRTDMLAYRIEATLAEAPYRQRLWELLTAVHCVHGDAVGALNVIDRCRVLFADDLGLDLPPGIEALRAAALSWDREKARRLVSDSALLAEPRPVAAYP